MEHVTDEFAVESIPIDNLVLGQSSTDIPNNWQTFHDYPKKHGWALGHNYELQLDQSTEPRMNLATFLQSWLFYGLVFTVVQRDHRPILQFEELNTRDHGGLSTATLGSKQLSAFIISCCTVSHCTLGNGINAYSTNIHHSFLKHSVHFKKSNC